MRTVSLQGTQISASERRNLALRAQVRSSFLSPHLLESTNQAIAQAAQIRDVEDSRFRFDRYETDQLMAQLKRITAPVCCDLFGY